MSCKPCRGSVSLYITIGYCPPDFGNGNRDWHQNRGFKAHLRASPQEQSASNQGFEAQLRCATAIEIGIESRLRSSFACATAIEIGTGSRLQSA
eukprot:350372-Chlamydomonas_euryale.AAC.8